MWHRRDVGATSSPRATILSVTPAERIREATGTDLAPLLTKLAPWGLEEEGGLALEAWLAATGAPGLHAATLAGSDPATAWSFVRLLAVSRPVAAILKQNPEFASLLLERGEESYVHDLRGSLVAEGRLLLAASTSPSVAGLSAQYGAR